MLCPFGPFLQIGFVGSFKKQSMLVPQSSDLTLSRGATQDLNPFATKDRQTSLDLTPQSLSSLHSTGALHLLVSSHSSWLEHFDEQASGLTHSLFPSCCLQTTLTVPFTLQSLLVAHWSMSDGGSEVRQTLESPPTSC